MSRIDGLSVQGIRSFAPDHREVLSLYKPLTLIVGSNGSGKTTVIECLKYATTGELPPNSKNGAFVHDPKFCNEKLVLANVGLKFTSVAGTQYTLYRKMQVTVDKRGKYAFKTIETTIKGGEHKTHTKSGGTEEMNAEVLGYLGVSRAILDNVIFCHQDESLWPMSEPSTLKKKFDEIFEAQQYTKVVEKLKLIRKKQGDKWRLSQELLKEDEKNLKMAKENSAIIKRLNDDIGRKQEEIATLAESIQEIEQKEKSKRDEANEYLYMAKHLETLQEKHASKSDSVVGLRNVITIMSESQQELEKLLSQSDQRLERLQQLIDEGEKQRHILGEEHGGLHQKLNEKLAEKGRLESDKEKYERQLQKRVEMIKEAASQHEISGFSNDLDDEQVQAFGAKIEAMLNTKKRECERIEKELTKKADEARNTISELETQKIDLNSKRASAKQMRADNDHRIKRLQTQADSIDCDEGQIRILEKNAAAFEERHQTTQKDFSESNWDGKIQSVKSELGELEIKSRNLNTELVNYTRLSSERAQLDLRRKELKDREGDLESLVGTYNGLISKAVRRDFNIESVDSDFKSVFNEQTALVKEERRKCDVLSKDLSQRDFELAEVRRRQSAAIDTRSKCEQSVLKALRKVVKAEEAETVTIDDFEMHYEEIEDTKEEREKDLHLFDKMKDYYQQAQTVLHTKNKCQLCDRGFENEQSKAKILKKISMTLVGQDKEAAQADFDEANKKFDRLFSVRADHEALQRLTKDISNLKKEVDEAVRKREEQLRDLETAEQKLAKAEEELDEIESVSKRVSEITRLHAKIQELKVETGRLQTQSQLSGSGRSADEIQDAQMANSEQMKEVNKNLDSLTLERQRLLDVINNLWHDLTENRNKLTQAKQQMTTKTALLNETKALKEVNQTQEKAVAGIDQQLQSLLPEIDAARRRRDAELERGREKARLLVVERDTIANTVNTLKMIEGDIQDYEESSKASSLASCERAITSLQQQLETLKSDLTGLQKRIDEQTTEKNAGASRKRNIMDNMRFQKDTKDLDEIERQIAKLTNQNAHKDYTECMKVVKGLEDDRTRLTAKKNTLFGSIQAMDHSLQEKMEAWDTFYSGAQKRYLKTKVEVETTKFAIEDVATTSNVVDKAVMQFHSLKMEEINRIANELWRATYKGTDIDTIAIRSENETPPATGSGKRKSYNYRVTMVKSDTEMDMRGRCSAGQKVLASIIIRLALAESFGINCGVIALDEPTTNLDSENILSLATSLHGIIKARQAQANFQLIVITHDEEFLRYMRCNEFCDWFFRVARDRDQKSTIKQTDIARITE